MNNETRKLWAEKTFELMNIGAGALIFGQALSGKQFSVTLGIIGVLLIVLGYALSYLLVRKRR